MTPRSRPCRRTRYEAVLVPGSGTYEVLAGMDVALAERVQAAAVGSEPADGFA